MATRKIRLDLSGTAAEGVGALIDVDFDSTNLDTDLEVNGNNIIREYTVDVPAGTYNLDISFKNDLGPDAPGEDDRNLFINKVEIADDGVTYLGIFLTLENTLNFNENSIVLDMPDGSQLPLSGLHRKTQTPMNPLTVTQKEDFVLNPDLDPTSLVTDSGDDNNWKPGDPPGDNPQFQYADYYHPATVWDNRTVTVQITFT